MQSAEGLKKLSKAANVYGAPCAVIACADRSRAWVRPYDQKSSADIDASILTDHMMLAATELSLGTTWICYFKPEMLAREFRAQSSSPSSISDFSTHAERRGRAFLPRGPSFILRHAPASRRAESAKSARKSPALTS